LQSGDATDDRRLHTGVASPDCKPSPVCVLMCLCRYSILRNPLPHTSHLKGLLPVCVLMCL
jgi:hypothetical protein